MIGSWIMLLKIIFLIYLTLVAIPLSIQAWNGNQGWKDRLMISVIHSHVYLIILVHVLVAVHLYEFLSMMIITLLTASFLIRRRHGKESISPFKKSILSFMHATDQKEYLVKWSKEALRKITGRVKRKWEAAFKKFFSRPLSISALALLFILSAAIRFSHSVSHYYFPSSDPYVHLKWVKLLGSNHIYVDGVYPFGFEAVISALHTIFNIDPYYILRFLGPIAGAFMVFTIYYVIRKHKPQSYGIAIFAMLIYLISTFQFGYIWRQYSSLSMEYGVIFILPAICFFIEYLRDKKKTDIIVSMECFLLTVLIHPYAAICLFIAYLVLFLFAIKEFPFLHLLKLVGGFAAAGFLGVLPLAAGLASGKTFHGESINFVQDSLNTSTTEKVNSGFDLALLLGRNEYGHIASFIAVSMLVLFILLLFRKKAWKAIYPFHMYISAGLALFLFYKAELVGLPSIMLPYRIEVTLVLLTSISIAAFLSLIPSWKFRKFISLIAILGYLYLSYETIQSYVLPKGNQLQYDESIEAYLTIKKDFPLQEWTIISSVEEYPLIIDYGWHYNLTDFIINMSKGEELEFPTKDVFWFVEKIPVGTDEKANAAGTTNFDLPSTGELLDFYRLPEYRLILHQKAWHWIENVQKQNPGPLKVYMETPRFIVFQLEQDPLKPYDTSKMWQRAVK